MRNTCHEYEDILFRSTNHVRDARQTGIYEDVNFVTTSSTYSATLLPPDVGRRGGLYATFKRHGISVAAAKVLQLPLDDRQRLHLTATKYRITAL